MKRSVGLERAGWMALLVVGSLALPACSDDSSDDAGGGDVIAGDGDTGGMGDGTMAGDGDTGSLGDEPPATMMPADVQCGSAVCPNLAAMLPIPGLEGLLPMPCCVDEASGTCGTLTAGVCEEPPPNHPVCPPLITGFGIDGTSCCIEDANECGIIAPPPLGMGECTSLVEASSAGGGLGGLIMFPAPVDCDGNPIEVPGADEDAG